jgi:hypothetical protein
MPGVFETLAPDPLDIVEEYFVLGALKQAFERIATRRGEPLSTTQRIKYKSDIEGSFEDELEILGIVKLHDFKIAYSVYQMLQERGLVYGRTTDGYSYVNEQAAWLIVSFLAQRMSRRLAMPTITDIDCYFYLSAACNLIDAGDPVDSRGLLASSVLTFHIPENIGEISIQDFIELRKRYEELRETFPLYLRDLGDLNQINEVRNLPDLIARIESTVETINRNMNRIKQSRIGESVRRWLPLGIGSAVTLAATFLPENPSLKYVTGTTAVAIQILTEVLHKAPILGSLQSAQSLLLSAKKDIINARKMSSSLSLRKI